MRSEEPHSLRQLGDALNPQTRLRTPSAYAGRVVWGYVAQSLESAARLAPRCLPQAPASHAMSFGVDASRTGETIATNDRRHRSEQFGQRRVPVSWQVAGGRIMDACAIGIVRAVSGVHSFPSAYEGLAQVGNRSVSDDRCAPLA